MIEDIRLIRSQLERCRKIIHRMASHAGETVGEALESVSIKKLSLACLDDLPQRGRVQLDLPADADTRILRVPLDGLSQALRGLVQNAIDADPTPRPVTLTVDHKDGFWRWRIEDRGIGMSEDQLNRVSEPFYTTKPPGKGMGLGVFLARNVVSRLGGDIQFESHPGKGTCVTVTIPEETTW